MNLTATTDTGTFARYRPYSDEREVIVRRGSELGFGYGLECGRRTLTVRGTSVTLVRFRQVLSPPPHVPGQTPMSPEAARRCAPEDEVAFLPGMEIAIRREPDAFNEREVEEIVAAFHDLAKGG